MTNNEAEVILNLKGNYDLDKLKKQYQKITKKYQQETPSNLSEDKKKNMQVINRAYEILKDYLKKNRVGSVNSKTFNNSLINYSYSNKIKSTRYKEESPKRPKRVGKVNIFESLIRIERENVEQLKVLYQLEINNPAIKLCDEYMEKLKKLDRQIFKYIDLEVEELLKEIRILQNKTINVAHNDYLEKLKCFYSKETRDLYFDEWKLNGKNISNEKDISLKINMFLSIINKAEKHEEKLYLNNIKNDYSLKIEDEKKRRM